MDEQKRREEVTKDADLKRPEEAIKDLEPEERESDGVKGGYTYSKIKYSA
jgi:hypothetical protein